MLKRQRPASPFRLAIEVPSLPDSTMFDIAHREGKRRRTVLDSSSQGSYTTQQFDGTNTSDDAYHQHEESAEQGVKRVLSPQPSEYKTTNSVLFELHAMHRHRLLFTPSQLFSSTESFSSKTHTYPAPHALMPPLTSSLDLVSSQPEHSPAQTNIQDQHPTATDSINLSSDAPLSCSAVEVVSVNHRYQEANRLLGSLFLSRMRERHTGEDGVP